MAQQELEAEEGRIAQALAAVDQRLNQISIDIEREKSLGADAEAAIQRMDAEVTEIEAAREGESERREEARAVMEEIAATLRERESELAELTQTVAAAEASKDALLNRRDELGRRHANLTERVETLQREREALSAEVGEDTALEETAKAVTEAEAAVRSADGPWKRPKPPEALRSKPRPNAGHVFRMRNRRATAFVRKKAHWPTS